MKIVKLIHPALGLCCQEVSLHPRTPNKIMQMWKYKYGKKYFECEVVVEVDGEVYENKPKFKWGVIINIKTGEEYYSVESACKSLGIDKSTLHKHLNRELKPQNNHLYLVKYKKN